jgi:hypothetical protein
MKVSCKSCRFFDPIKGTVGNEAIGAEGYCRISPPMHVANEFEERFPIIGANDWCGSHTPVPNSDDGTEDNASDDLLSGIMDDPKDAPEDADAPAERDVPRYDNPNRPLEPLDVVLLDNVNGTRGVTGIVQRVFPPANGPDAGDYDSPDAAVTIQIAGNVYQFSRSQITQRVGRVGGSIRRPSPGASDL